MTQRVLLFAQQKEKFGSKVTSVHSIVRCAHTGYVWREEKGGAPVRLLSNEGRDRCHGMSYINIDGPSSNNRAKKGLKFTITRTIPAN